MKTEAIPIDVIEVEEYNGPVYNLQTDAEEYIVGGIFTHNCPHIWHVDGAELPEDRCKLLWMGS